MKYITPTLKTNRLILKKGTYEDYVKVYEYDFTWLRNIAGEFEFVKYDLKKYKVLNHMQKKKKIFLILLFV